MILGVDIGGTKTLLGVFDSHGKLTEQLKFLTPKQYDKFLSSLTTELSRLKNQDFKSVVVAIPGLIDRSEGVAMAYGNLPWPKEPIGPDVEKIVNCPVIIENDSKLAALSEALLLEKKYHKVFYVTISTGIGGGLIIDGKIDSHFQDSEVGQMPLEHKGKLQRWEDFASGRAIVAKYGKKAQDITDPAQWNTISRNIAIGLIDVIATLTPDIIVIGGGVGTHYNKFKDPLHKHLQAYDNPLIVLPPIIKAKRAEEAVIYGCYALAKSHGRS